MPEIYNKQARRCQGYERFKSSKLRPFSAMDRGRSGRLQVG